MRGACLSRKSLSFPVVSASSSALFTPSSWPGSLRSLIGRLASTGLTKIETVPTKLLTKILVVLTEKP